MKKIVLILMVFSGILLASCGNKNVDLKNNAVETNITAADTKVDAKIEYSDPARIAGSNFGDFFISMIRTQNYDMAIKFTAKASIDKIGVDKVREYYSTANFKGSFNMKLVSKSEKNGIITLKFAANEFATNRFKEINIVIENDSCKLVLPNKISDLLK